MGTASNRLLAILSEALRPPPEMTVSEWADGFRMLDSRSSAEPGPWRTSRTPYLKEPMDHMGPQSPLKRVVLMFASQVGKTEGLLNTAGYFIDYDPAPMMMVQPTDKAMERFSRQRITPLVEETPVLKAKVSESKSRASGNTLSVKEFPGGVWLLVGANSPTDLASSPIRILLLDEVDRFPRDLGAEGDPISLAEARTRTFHNRKICEVSTPTVHLESRIEADFARTDQRYYEVPCPHCGTYQRLVWAQVVWPKGEPLLASYQCAHCDELIPHSAKARMLAQGEWCPEDEDVAEMKRKEFDPPLSRDPEAVGYALSTLYSPWYSWGAMAAQFVRCAKDPVLLKVFVNTLLGEAWHDQSGEGVEGEGLLARRETYGPGSGGPELPRGVAVLTAGADVQADRITIEVVGWGAGEESWSVEVVDVYGDTSVPPSPQGGDVWAEAEAVLSTTYAHESGGRLGVEAFCCDSGHQSLNVYQWIRPRQRKRWWAVKGRAGDHKLWPRSPSRNNKGRVDLYLLGVDQGKEQTYARLRIEDPGPGFCHFGHHNDATYFSELTAEVKRTKFVRGHRSTYWHLPNGRRNEALDRRVYALAALHGWRSSSRMTIAKALDRLRQRAEPERAHQTQRPKSRRGGYVGKRRDHWLKR